MSKEPQLIESPLSQSVSQDGKTVKVEIYRLDDSAWTLEIVDEIGNSTVWDDQFATDSEALSEARKAIQEEKITTFIGPSDGKSHGDWR